MKTYDIFALIIIPFSIILFSLDYLSNNEIVHSELKLGIIYLIHHFLYVIITNLPILLIISRDPKLLFITSIIFIITQIGWLINKDFCFLIRMQNNIIDNKNPNRMWRENPMLLIKHYIRGDSWGYRDYTNYKHDDRVLFGNLGILIWCVKIILHGHTS